MTKISLKKATHIYAQPGLVTVSEAEAARLCSIGVAQVVTEGEAKEAPKKPAVQKTNKKAEK